MQRLAIVAALVLAFALPAIGEDVKKPVDKGAARFEELLARSEAKGFRVYPAREVYYVPKDGETFIPMFLDIRLDGEFPTEGFFSLGGVAEPVSVKSSDKLIHVYKPGDPLPVGKSSKLATAILKGPCKATITAWVGEHKAEVTVEVVELPFAKGDSAKAVIEAIGLPDEKRVISARWPKAETVDGVAYTPKAGSPIRAEHWQFAKYPGAVVSVVDGQVFAVGHVD